MKINDFRKMISGADRKALEQAFSECYKSLTKAQKEKMDGVIPNILSGVEVIASPETKKPEVDFAAMDKEITKFIGDAREGYYYDSNRVIPKKDRPKWRFHVMRYIKTLTAMTPEDENYARAVELMESLYKMLCSACWHYMFHTTDDPFRSIGWDQPALYGQLVRMVGQRGYTRENLHMLLDRASDQGLARWSVNTDMALVLIEELQEELKKVAIDEAKKMATEVRKTLPDGKYLSYRFSCNPKVDKVENLCDFILLASIPVSDAEEAVRFYFETVAESDREIILYCILRDISMMNDNDLWVRVYEGALDHKIQPRDGLQKDYAMRLTNRNREVPAESD